MKYFILVLVFGVMFYLLSFSKYNWNKKNKLAAVGSAIIGIVAFGLTIFLLFFSNYEL